MIKSAIFAVIIKKAEFRLFNVSIEKITDLK